MNWQERAEKAEAELARLAKQEPVEYQFLDGGKWHPFISDDHMKNTIAAGAWEIRQLYAAPVPAPNDTALIEGVADKIGVARDFGSRRHDLQFWLDSPVAVPAAPAVPDDDAARDGLSVRAYHEWIRGALCLPDTAPMRFDFYAQEIEKRLAAPAVPDDRVSQDDAALMQAASALTLYRAGESAEYMAKAIEALLQTAPQSDKEV